MPSSTSHTYRGAVSSASFPCFWEARDYNLEKGIRRVILLFIALQAISIFALLAYKLKLSERDQLRRHILGSPEARQREQEYYRE